ncbi:MAG: rod shape-determining protein RodA [Myxacorys chilensis ATA2-1-KO14]|jgi:rod shape determining protein RodA|nr:rod shape-determining protein RodA [Myxacorys chilensis ATA2-1-KO14]
MFRKSKSFLPPYLKGLLQPWQEMDWLLFAVPIGLNILGGLMISSVEANAGLTDWWRHWITGGIGIILALLIARWRYDQLLQWKWWVYGLTNSMLLLVMFFGTEGLGAQRWINIFGFYLQPSEFAKLGIIITIAAMLHQRSASTIPMVIKVLAVAGVPWILIFLEPNLGTSLVFGAIAIGMLYWGNANPGWLLLLISPIISAILFNMLLPVWGVGIAAIAVWILLIGFVAWRTLPWKRYGTLAPVVLNLLAGGLGRVLWQFVLKDYQKARIVMFRNPEQDPLGGGYHLIQSRIAIGAGELWGRGLYKGTQTQLNFIPEQHTDFIFTAIGEELGFIGAAAVLLSFLLICYRLLVIAQNAKDDFGSLIAVGVFSMIVFQVTINIGMTINLSPVTGIPLPWLSYGNAALLMNFLALGLVESVANFRQRLKF